MRLNEWYARNWMPRKQAVRIATAARNGTTITDCGPAASATATTNTAQNIDDNEN
jgi:hypothetical protein